MKKEISERFDIFETRISRLERDAGIRREIQAESAGRELPPPISMDLVLPEMNVSELYFSETRVHAIFDFEPDGWYHSRRILFCSARTTQEQNGADLLTKYLISRRVREAFAGAFPFDVQAFEVLVELPVGNEGVKRYNGANMPYWLREARAGSASFCAVTNNGFASYYNARDVCGCAPMFRIADKEEK